MSTPPLFSVTHSCGHEWTHDLSARPAPERAGFARWLTSTFCPDCSSPTCESDHERKREADLKAAASWAEATGMPRLEGPRDRIGEAMTARYRLLRAAYRHHVQRGGMTAEQFATIIEGPARSVTCASWWIDRRDTDPADTEELMDHLTADWPAPGESDCGRWG
jgi:hypothetical protein